MVSPEDCVVRFVEMLLSTDNNQCYIGCYLNCCKKLFQLSELRPSILSEYKTLDDVKKDLIANWICFFNGVPADVMEECFHRMEDHIVYLHDKVPEKYWCYEQHDYLYAQYISPLHLAAWCGDFEFFNLIHTKYPSIWDSYIHSRDILGNLPMHVSYFCCDFWSTPITDNTNQDCICSCLYDMYNALGLTALHVACIFNQSKGVSQLLNQQVDKHIPVHFFSSEPLDVALEEVSQIRDVCLYDASAAKKPAKINQWSSNEGCSSLYGSCNGSCYGSCYDSFSFGRYGSDNSMEDCCGSCWATCPCLAANCCETGSVSSAVYALEGLSALHLAMRCNAPQCALLLATPEGLTTSTSETPSPLQMASLYSFALFAKLPPKQRQAFLAALPKLWDSRGNPSRELLPCAILNGILSSNYRSFLSLLHSQSDLQFRGNFAPLQIACVLLNETFVRLLIGYGADVSIRTLTKESCLHILVRSSAKSHNDETRGELLGLLLMAGCDPNWVDDEGISPLFAAVQLDDIYAVSALLAYDSGAVRELQGVYGRTAFQEALQRKNEDIARLILHRCPEVMNIADKRGWYPLHYVIQHGDIQSMVFMLNHTVPLKREAVEDMEKALRNHGTTLQNLYVTLSSVIQGQLKYINRLCPSENRHHLIFFLPNKMTERCMQCNRKFSLITTKRHCRNCGQILCMNCCPADADKTLDHICKKCRAFGQNPSFGRWCLQRFEDGIKSYLIKFDSLLKRKQIEQ